MDWINIGKQIGKLRQRFQQMRQPKPQKKAPTKPAPQYSQQAKNAKIKANMAKQKPVEKASNMPKAKAQAKATNAKANVKATAKDANAIKAPAATNGSTAASPKSYKPRGVTPPQRGKSKGKGRSL